MSGPRVSVVVPVFNTAAYLGEAIESVHAQTFDDWELLIADGGSTDGSLEIAKGFGGTDPQRIQVLEAVPGVPSRPARNRNRALRYARGDLVAFLDSDDRWEPPKLARLIDVFDVHPEIGLVYTYSQCIDEEGRPIPKGSQPGQTGTLGMGVPGVMHDGFERMVRKEAHAQTSSVVARTHLVRTVGAFDEHIFPDGDTLLWTRLSRAAPVYFLPEVLSYKRVRPEGIVRVVTPLQYAQFRINYLIALARDAREPNSMLIAAVRDAAEELIELHGVSAKVKLSHLLKSLHEISNLEAFGRRVSVAVGGEMGVRVVRQKIRALARRAGAGRSGRR